MRKSSPVWHQKVQSSLAQESPVGSGIYATIATISIEISDPNPGSTIVIASDITVKCSLYSRGSVEQRLRSGDSRISFE